MLFKPEQIEQIKMGNKIETRRVVKPGEKIMYQYAGKDHATVIEFSNGRTKWQVGKTYAICPGRGKSGVGFIRINGLSLDEDVRRISLASARDEGFLSVNSFLSTWIHINDHSAQACWEPQSQRWIWYTGDAAGGLEADWWAYLDSRPAARYRAWVIWFSYVGETK